MKRLFSLMLLLGCASAGMAQLKAKVQCPDFYVDILDGTINGLKPSNTQIEIKEKFPCFTSAEDESQEAKCGGGIFFKTKDVSFYTRRKYIEIGPKFAGKTSMPLLGTKRGTHFSRLGNPKVKDDTWEAYEMQYGCLVLHFDVAGPNGKVKYFQFSTIGTEGLTLCE